MYVQNDVYRTRFFCRHQRNKLKLDDVPKLPEWQRLRQQHTANDNVAIPNLVIRRPSLVQGPGGDQYPRTLSGGKYNFANLR